MRHRLLVYTRIVQASRALVAEARHGLAPGTAAALEAMAADARRLAVVAEPRA